MFGVALVVYNINLLISFATSMAMVTLTYFFWGFNFK